MDYKITSELKALLKYIRENIARRYRLSDIDIPSFLLGVMEFKECEMHKALNSIMLRSDFNKLKQELVGVHDEDKRAREIVGSLNDDDDARTFNERFDAALKACDTEPISSLDFMLTVLRMNAYASEVLSKYGITMEQCKNVTGKKETKKTTKKSSTAKKAPERMGEVQKKAIIKKGIVDETLDCYNDMAEKGEIWNVIGNGPVYDKIFTAWARADRNNVILVGKPGVGKTATVKHIANMIVNGDVPQQFRNKRLMRLNLAELMPPNGVKGFFEEKYKTIVEDATGRDCYIFFIDEIRSALDETAHYSDMGIETVLDMVLSNPNILFITTANEHDYLSLVDANPFFKRRMCKITLEEKTEEECIDIVNATKKKYEDFHNVTFSDEFITNAVKLTKKHISSCVLPDTIYDVIDEVGAIYSVNSNEDENIEAVRSKLSELKYDRERAVDNPAEYTKERIDEIDAEILSLTTHLSELEKAAMLSERATEASIDVLKRVVSGRCSKPVTDIGQDERERLRSLDTKLSECVIGQDEAVEKVSRAVKRSRTGLSRPGRPPVFMFVGSTGTGKTLLAKKLAETVFGDEKDMVRLDMSEYNDRTSVNKLYGASPGYIGYDKGGVLTEAVKKNSHCVILLDEIEKAAEEVHDTLLQVFDDGRLTDNRGVTVNFNDTIIIMTSNAGASEADERGGGVGFMKDNTLSDSIYVKSIRKRFKPEFINRIDDIVMFKKLGREELDKITSIEVKKAVERIMEAGYTVDENFAETAETVVRESVDTSRYGARPIPSAVERVVMDPVSDYIISEGVNVIPSTILQEKTCNSTATKDV